MSKLKKTISLFIVFVMAVGILPSAMASTLPNDVIGTKYEESVELLQALEIMVGDKDTGDFRLEDGIVRSEVAKIAVLLMGLKDAAESSQGRTKFPDVPADHWATGYINVATSQGIVIGDDRGNFRPNDTITFAEAVTIFVRALGYKPMAEDKGGFPSGYLVTAGDIGMLKNGVTASKDNTATRGIAAMLAFNSLTLDLMEKTGFGANEQYEVVDKTLLEDKLNVEQIYGQVVANSHSSLTGTSSLKEGEISIKSGEETVIYNTKEGEDLLARNVIAYVKEDKAGDKNIILITVDDSKTKELTINIKDIEKIEGNVISYWAKETDRKPTEITLTEGAKIFYNGILSEMTVADLADLKSGHINLVNVTKDAEYGYVFVTEYKNMVVDEVSTVSHKISDKFNLLSLTLDPEDKNISFKIIKDGKEIDISEIKEWDILSVAMDKATAADSTKFTVYVSDETVTGKITEIEDGKYTIGDKQYEIAQNYVDASQPELKLNDEGTFYLDIEGKIAAVDTQTKAGSNYAYLVKTEIKSTLDNVLQLKLFTSKGEVVILDAASKIKVNNVSNLSAEAAKEAIGEGAGLITYEVNKEGKVSYVNTAQVNENPGTSLKNVFSLDFTSYDSEEGVDNGVVYKASTNRLDKFNLSEDTIIFDIPAGETDPANFTVRKPDMFVDKTTYNVDIFDLTEDLTATVVIVKNSASQINSEASVAVVEKITTTQNEDGIAVHKLYALQDGKRIEMLTKDTATLTKGEGALLETGDVIQFGTNSKGEIDKVTVLFDSDDKANNEVNIYKAYEGTEMETVIGRITKKFSTSINITANNLSETNFGIKNATIYMYDHEKPANSKVSVVDASYLTKYDEADPQKVFIRVFKGVVTEIVIINE